MRKLVMIFLDLLYIFYLHCLSFELFWLFLNWPTFWVFLFWLPPMLLNRIHLHLHVQFYVKQQYGKMLCEETNLDLLYKWKNKSHTKGPNIYTSLKANFCQGRTWGFVFSIFFCSHCLSAWGNVSLRHQLKGISWQRCAIKEVKD